MSEHILTMLRRKLDDLSGFGELDVETRRNALKEELQFYVLNFIYHHPEYSSWIMYGGSALRIVHDLNRMSVDLDFEVSHAITETFLEELKKEIKEYFESAYGARPDFLSIKIIAGRGLILKFHTGDTLGLGHPSGQVHVKIDLNYFTAKKIVTERRPITKDQFSFVILTYNMSALMASKIAAIFLRGRRGAGHVLYEEKGRDIYDLLWYMDKKIVPDFDYLAAKGIDAADPRALFGKLTFQMNKVSNENLKQDLLPLFADRAYIENWLKNWLESYLRLVEEYDIRTLTTLAYVRVHNDFMTDVFSFSYWYNTENGGIARVTCRLSDYWIEFGEGDLPTSVNEGIVALVEGDMKDQLNDKLKRYVTLFYEKAERYLTKTNRTLLGTGIETKVIRMTANKLNQKEQIVLNKSALLSCELDDLLK